MDKNNAKPAENQILGNIENAVNYLMQCRQYGQNVYIDFNGYRLYSADVTMDSAYLQIVGMTKEEDAAIREEYYKAETEEKRDEIIAKWSKIRKAHLEELKKTAKPAEKDYLGTIDKTVEYLEECRKLGQNVYFDFNGHILYSADVTLNSAYLEIVGMTKEEDAEIRAKFSKAKTEEEQNAIIEEWDKKRKSHKRSEPSEDLERAKTDDDEPEL